MSDLKNIRFADGERGAALLTVLLLVAVISIIAAIMLDRVSIATRLAANGQSLSQARLYSVAAENLAIAQIKRLVDADPARTTNQSGWVGREFTLPFESGLARGRVRDGGNCFNLNSVVSGAKGNYRVNGVGVQQFKSLMYALKIPANEADIVAASLTDWIDSDQNLERGGAEDGYYLQLDTPYLTADRLIADPTELRAVKGVTADIYAALRGWICALPMAELSPININTLGGDQAVLLTMMAPSYLPPERAQRVLAARPAGGFAGVRQFWQAAVSNPENLPRPVQSQVQVRTRWFMLDMTIELGEAELIERALIDASLTPARLVHRQWGEDL